MPARETTRPQSRRTPADRGHSKSPRIEAPVVEVFFILGAVLVVIGFLYSLAKSWPSFDPLALAMLVGIGLLLVVICERLRLVVRELRVLAALMRTAVEDSEQRPPA